MARGELVAVPGDYRTARYRLGHSVEWRMGSDAIGCVHGLAEFAGLAAAERLPAAAVRLAAATGALTQKTAILVQHSERRRYWASPSERSLRTSNTF